MLSPPYNKDVWHNTLSNSQPIWETGDVLQLRLLKNKIAVPAHVISDFIPVRFPHFYWIFRDEKILVQQVESI